MSTTYPKLIVLRFLITPPIPCLEKSRQWGPLTLTWPLGCQKGQVNYNIKFIILSFPLCIYLTAQSLTITTRLTCATWRPVCERENIENVATTIFGASESSPPSWNFRRMWREFDPDLAVGTNRFYLPVRSPIHDKPFRNFQNEGENADVKNIKLFKTPCMTLIKSVNVT